MGTNLGLSAECLCVCGHDLCAARFLVHSFCQRGFVDSLGNPPAQGELASGKAAGSPVPTSFGWKAEVAEPQTACVRELWCLGSWSGLSCVAPDSEIGSRRHFLALSPLPLWPGQSWGDSSLENERPLLQWSAVTRSRDR